MKPDCPLSNVPTKMFHWDFENKVFSQEISSLSGFPLFDRIYSDACDVGFKLKSAKTGRETVVYLSDTRVVEGETHFWTFKPIDESLGFEVIVFND